MQLHKGYQIPNINDIDMRAGCAARVPPRQYPLVSGLEATVKPFSQATENNKAPILAVFEERFTRPVKLLEIGTGNGQHAVYIGAHMPHVVWQTSDLPANHPGINLWLEEANLSNVSAPIVLDVDQLPWPVTGFDVGFSANTAHIMSWPSVVNMFAGIATALRDGGRFLLYGPFNYNSAYTSESNARFDALLRSRDPLSGIRDSEALHEVAAINGLSPHEDIAMPANNRILVWAKP